MAKCGSMSRFEVRETEDPIEKLCLVDNVSRARAWVAPPRGGMVTRFTVGDEAVLFLDEKTLRDFSKSVRGGVPLLMPAAGRLSGDKYTVSGRSIEMKQHGFARNLPWKVLSVDTRDGATVKLGVRDTTVSRESFPFGFEFEAEYALREKSLEITLGARCTEVGKNPGAEAMPIHVGVHPYFFVPCEVKAKSTVESDATRGWNNVTHEETLFTALPSFGEGEIDLHLRDHHPKRTILHRPGLANITLAWSDNLTTLVLWTLPGREFICVEPWSAPANALNDPKVLRLGVGESAQWRLVISAGETQ